MRGYFVAARGAREAFGAGLRCQGVWPTGVWRGGPVGIGHAKSLFQLSSLSQGTSKTIPSRTTTAIISIEYSSCISASFLRWELALWGTFFIIPILLKSQKKVINKHQNILFVRFISGSRNFLEDLLKKLSDKKLVSGGSIHKKNRGYCLLFSKHDSIALFNFMYNNVSANLFLERKYDTFKKVFAALKINADVV